MGFDNIIQILLPKDDKFFGFFEETTESILKASELMKTIAGAAENDQAGILNQVHDYEHRCDEITHKIFAELNATFVTPFDREDIQTLASALDDIIDFMDEAARRFTLYKIREFPQSMMELIDILNKSIAELHRGVALLRDKHKTKELRKILEKVHEYENEADLVFEQTIAHLFENEKDSIKVIKLKDIYGSLERATDKCEDAANVLETILIKHA